MPMETCISDSINRIKNMEKALFSGSATAKAMAPKQNIKKYNSTKVHGGEDYLMAKDNTKNPMVLLLLFRRFLPRSLQKRIETWKRCIVLFKWR